MTSTSKSRLSELKDVSSERAELLNLLMERKTRRAQEIRPVRRSYSQGECLLPASWAQQSLYFVHQLNGQSSHYHIPLALRLLGDLNQEALSAALDGLVQRHEVLRTTFAMRGGELQQQIRPSAQFALRLLDVSDLHAEDQARELFFHKRQEANEEFDLQTGPLIRGRLIRLSAEENVLLITVHHIVFDGWSTGILYRELGALYGAFSGCSGSPLPPLPVQYADYALWQRKRLTREVQERQLAYWRDCLAGAPPQLELPADHIRPAVQTFRGGVVKATLDAGLSAKLAALARRNDVTLFMTLLGGVAIVLARLSNQQDVLIGSPVINRQGKELEELIGFFVNMLPLRIMVLRAETVRLLLARVKAMTLNAYMNQEIPFPRLVEALRPERDLSRNPIFQVMLAMQNATSGQPGLVGLGVSEEEGQYRSSMCDLSLSFAECGSGIDVTAYYASDLFKEATMERWMKSIVVVLDRISDDMHAVIGDLDILPPADRSQILIDFNSTRRDFGGSLPVHKWVERTALDAPDAVAVVCGNLQLTYVELNTRANRIARALIRTGVRPESCVAFYMERGLELIVGLLGVLKAGGVYVPLDRRYPADRIRHVLDSSAAILVLTDGELQHQLSGMSAQIIAIEQLVARASVECCDNLSQSEVEVTPRNLAYVIYTSGSTGTPKGVMIEHGGLSNMIGWQCEKFALTPTSRCSCVATIGFDAATFEIWPPLCAGGTLVVAGPEIAYDPEALLDWWSREPLDMSFLPTPLGELILQREIPNKRLKSLLVGGDRLRQKPVSDAYTLFNNYGPTESTVVATCGSVSGRDDVLHIGRPIANTQIYILDEWHQPVPVGVPGELFIGGVGVARGYQNQPCLTAERFSGDPFSETPEGRMYKTGDLAKWRVDGTIEYLGRNDHQVKIRGFRIELGEIEVQIARHELVKESVVLARENGELGECLVAYVVPADLVHAARAQLAEILREHLKTTVPEYMIPSAFVIMDRLPLTANAKIDHRALPAPAPDSYSRRKYAPPEGRTEERLAQIWRDLLKLDLIGRDDNFFELGGHSLHGVQLVARIRDELQVALTVSAIFQCPTIAKLAARLDSPAQAHASMRSATREVSSIQQADAIHHPLSFSQRAHWNLYDLGTRSAIRQVASAMHIRGQLQLGCLTETMQELLRRHDALRTQVRVVEGGPAQIVSAYGGFVLEIQDLTRVAQSFKLEQVGKLVEQTILAPVDVQYDPLFAAQLLRLSDEEHVLIIAMEHLISDGFSLELLGREIWEQYASQVTGAEPSLPAIGRQFWEHARQQQLDHESWVRQHGRYWSDFLASNNRTRFPRTQMPLEEDIPGWFSAQIRINRSLKLQLGVWSREHGTTVAMAVFTAYVALVLRWCDVEETSIQFVIDGRGDPDIQNTVGYFASSLFLRIASGPSARLSDLLTHVTEEYCRAYEHADACRLESQLPRPDFTRGTAFNWVPQVSRLEVDAGRSTGKLICSPYSFEHPMLSRLRRDSEPVVQLFDGGEEISGGVFYPLQLFSKEQMNRFASSLPLLIDQLLTKPDTPLCEIELG